MSRRSCRFPSAVFLVTLLLTPTAHGQSDKHPQVPDQVRAFALWQQGCVLHVNGRYQAAVDRFRESIDVLPTAEGHTFPG